MARYQRKDAYHQRAKREGFRSRAAYKLADVQKRHKLLRRGQKVFDLGCWPGGWLQVTAAIIGPQGRLVGIDKAALDEPMVERQVAVLQGDLEAPDTVERLLEALGGPADVVLSDAAPKITGVRDTDRANEERLLEAIEALLPALLRPGGDLLLKIMEGPEAQQIDKRLRRCFERGKTVKPEASRKGTTERYLLARSFRGA